MKLDLVAAARAAIAKTEDCMVGIVGDVVALLMIDLRELQFYDSFYVQYHFNLSTLGLFLIF